MPLEQAGYNFFDSHDPQGLWPVEKEVGDEAALTDIEVELTDFASEQGVLRPHLAGFLLAIRASNCLFRD
jgi:hypothetical protein